VDYSVEESGSSFITACFNSLIGFCPTPNQFALMWSDSVFANGTGTRLKIRRRSGGTWQSPESMISGGEVYLMIPDNYGFDPDKFWVLTDERFITNFVMGPFRRLRNTVRLDEG